MSVSRLDEHVTRSLFCKSIAKLMGRRKNDETLDVDVRREDRSFKFEIVCTNKTRGRLFLNKQKDGIKLWHERLGYTSMRIIERM